MAAKRHAEDIMNDFSRKQVKKEDKTATGKDPTQQKTENRAFRFSFKNNEYVVSCDSSMTVMEALHQNTDFRAYSKKNKGKETVIQREILPRGVIAPHFPCCLITNSELLTITFIKAGEGGSTEENPQVRSLLTHSLVSCRENFIVFNVKTTGGKNIKAVLKNQALKISGVDYVSVYAVQEEKVKEALRRDGRFSDVIFQKRCSLFDLETEAITNMSNTVDHLDGKQLQVKVADNPSDSQSSSQEMDGCAPFEASSSPQAHPENTNCSKDSAEALRQTPPSTKKNRKPGGSQNRIQVKNIPDTEEILKMLRNQFGSLLATLKEREGLTKPAEVKKFLREEYDKSAQSFSEVKRVRRLVELSDSVCMICVDDSPMGTGFLLFGRFILTNYHVVENEIDRETGHLRQEVAAVFGYKDFSKESMKIMPVKGVVAGCKGKDDKEHLLDFALLELSDEVDQPKCVELLGVYSHCPTRGGICLIGHPGSGVKKLDPCFIIPEEDIPKARNKHLAENKDFFHVITQKCFNMDYYLNQISYNSCFFYGSSGSPVFDDHCRLVGVHTGGYTYPGEGGKTRSVMEYSLSMLPILEMIVRQCRENGRADVVQHFENQNNMKYVLQMVDEEVQ